MIFLVRGHLTVLPPLTYLLAITISLSFNESIICGTYFGSWLKSASMTHIILYLDFFMPSKVADVSPRFFLVITFIFLRFSFFTTSDVPSGELSSTTITSYLYFPHTSFILLIN